MSRLDSMIARLVAQRDLLNLAADMTREVEGPILELGLGNGRTYSHLRELMPEREIFVFEHEVHASTHSIPDSEHLILGNIRDTLPFSLPRLGGEAAFAHADLSNGDPTADLARAAWLTPMLADVMVEGGIVLSGHALDDGPLFQSLPLPDHIRPGRYFLYRRSRA